MVHLTRRKALYTGLASLAFSVMPKMVVAALGTRGTSAKDRANALDCYRELFTDLEAPRTIGQRYLESSPHEADCAFLQKVIGGAIQPRNARQLKTLLAQRREQDFRRDDIAIVDGWVLARTEVRVCALIALL